VDVCRHLVGSILPLLEAIAWEELSVVAYGGYGNADLYVLLIDAYRRIPVMSERKREMKMNEQSAHRRQQLVGVSSSSQQQQQGHGGK
jgi:hypothetical protein